MSLMDPHDLIPFVVGIIIGALGTISIFRGSLISLEVKYGEMLSRIAEIKTNQDTLEKDFNNVANKVRSEIKEAIDDYRESRAK